MGAVVHRASEGRRGELQRWRALAALAAVVLLASACGGGDDGEADTATGPGDDDSGEPAGDDSAEAGALAEAIRIDAAVDARVADAADFVGVTDPVPVAVGDEVRTDSTGFAEIAYFDGSVTRLDVETDFEVVELVDSPGDSVIRTQMGVGRTWHRVQALSGNDTYEAETSVATAVVRGTAFVIECTETACTFTVLEGTLELVLPPDGPTIVLEAGEVLTIEADTAPGEPELLTSDLLAVDDWLARNNDLDQDSGNDDLAGETAAPPAAEGLDGSWGVEFALVDFAFEPIPGLPPPEPSEDFSESWEITCDGDACVVDRFDLPVGPLGWAETFFGQPVPIIELHAADGGLSAEESLVVECAAAGASTAFEQTMAAAEVDTAAGTMAGTLTRSWDPPVLQPADLNGRCSYAAWT